MKKDKKIIVLVMCASNKRNTDYLALERCIKNTWFNIQHPDTEIIFYKGWESYKKIETPIYRTPDLILPVIDRLELLNEKTLMAFEWINTNYNFEYIYRSNLGAYVNTSRLVTFLEDKPKEKFYCGIKEQEQYGPFASGAGYFLSKDLIDLILKYKSNWPSTVVQPDDQTLGYFMHVMRVPVHLGAKRKNICNNLITYNINDVKTYVPRIPEEELYHIRLRSSDRKLDIENMKKIYAKHVQ